MALVTLPHGILARTPSSQELTAFTDRVDEVAQLIQGLHKGDVASASVEEFLEAAADTKPAPRVSSEQLPRSEHVMSPERREELVVKVHALQEQRRQKQAAQERYNRHVTQNQVRPSATDYRQWDLWCPSDEESESPPPDSVELRALQKDIDERHDRLLEKRQVADRQRSAGNALFKTAQHSAAYGAYSTGLSADKCNMALHANAAAASLQMSCYVQAIEHCNKVLQLAEFMHQQPKHPLCIKALQRRSVARKALEHHKQAWEDAEHALRLSPAASDLQLFAQQARRQWHQHQKEIAVAAAATAADNSNCTAKELCPYQQIRTFTHQIQAACPKTTQPDGTGGCSTESSDSIEASGHGLVALPPRPSKLPGQSETTLSKVRTASNACRELKGLLQDGSCRVYLRLQKGLEALMALLPLEKPLPQDQRLHSYVAPALAALDAAATDDWNMQLLLNLHLPARCAALVASIEPTIAQAALDLLCTCCNCADGARATATGLGSPGNESLQFILEALPNEASQGVQVNTMKMLGNCATHAVLANALVHLPHAIDIMCDLLTSRHLLVVEKAVTLLGNLALVPSVRSEITKTDRSVAALLELMVSHPAEAAEGQHHAVVLAAATGLFNLLHDEAARRALLQLDGLPAVMSLLTSVNMNLMARAVGMLACLASHLNSTASGVAQVLQAVVDCAAATAQFSAQPDPLARSAVLEIQKGAMQLLAVCAVSDPAAAHGQLLQPKALQLLHHVLQDQQSKNAAVGNAAMCIMELARRTEALAMLRRYDFVPALLGAVHSRQGSVQRNAAIALGRLAHDPACLKKIRNMQGLEIIHSLVMPIL